MVEKHLESEHEVKTDAGNKNSSKAEKVRRPEISPEMSTEKWSYFETRWEVYKSACNLRGDEVLLQLRECMIDSVREDHHNQFSGIKVEYEAELLLQVKSVAVKKANWPVDRDGLAKMRQEKGEPVRKYVGRVRKLALVREYMVACGCSKTVSYAEQVIKDQVIAGLQDPDIKVDVLSHDKVNVLTLLPDLVNFVESKETGKMSMAIRGVWHGGQDGQAAEEVP